MITLRPVTCVFAQGPIKGVEGRVGFAVGGLWSEKEPMMTPNHL